MSVSSLHMGDAAGDQSDAPAVPTFVSWSFEMPDDGKALNVSADKSSRSATADLSNEFDSISSSIAEKEQDENSETEANTESSYFIESIEEVGVGAVGSSFQPVEESSPRSDYYYKIDGVPLLSIAGMSCEGLTISEAAQLLQDHEFPVVEVEENGTISKKTAVETTDTNEGLGLEIRDGVLSICAIRPGSGNHTAELIIKGLRLVSAKSYRRTESKDETFSLGVISRDDPMNVAEAVGLVVVTATKESPGCKIGISLRHYKNCLVISDIQDDGIFAESAVEVGQKLLSVNSTDVKGMTNRQAIELLKDAVNEITLVTEDIGIVAVSAQKKTNKCRVGVSLINDHRGNVVISDVCNQGILAKSNIKAGLKLVSVNKQDVTGMTKKQAASLLEKASEEVVVLAEDIGLTVVVANKEKPQSKVGISLTEDFKGNIIISGTSDEGIFAGSDLRAGLKLVSVNKVNVSGMSNDEAIALFKKAKNKVTVVAKDIGLVIGSATKDTVQSKVGISLTDFDFKGNLVITNVSRHGIFADSGISVGHIIVSVNNTEVSGMTKYEAIGLFKDAIGKVTVLVEDVGLVVASATKRNRKSKIGLELTEHETGHVILSSISETGIFAGSALRVGHALVNVNNTDLTGLTKRSVMKLLQSARTEICVMTQDIGLSPETKARICFDQEAAFSTEETEPAATGNTGATVGNIVIQQQNETKLECHEGSQSLFKKGWFDEDVFDV